MLWGRFVFALLALPLFLTLGCEAPDRAPASDPPALDEHVRGEVVGGTSTGLRPEVGTLHDQRGNLRCTATLVSPLHFVTAAHCIQFLPITTGGSFRVGDSAYPIDRVQAFGAGLNDYDVALGRLSSPVPAAVATPARIAFAQPARGATVTAVGYGCDMRSASGGSNLGVKRARTFPWASPSHNNCEGDSGGPVFEGTLAERGALVGLISGYLGEPGDPSAVDILSDATLFRERIEQHIRAWEDGLEPGIDRPGLDLRTLFLPSATACRAACGEDAACRAFSFESARESCRLKRAVPPAVPADGFSSGLPAEVDALDRSGDLLTPATTTASADACRVSCMASAECQAFRWQSTTGTCEQRASLAPATPCASCASGSRRAYEQDVSRGGRDYATVTTISAEACAVECERDGACLAFTWVASTRRCAKQSSVAAPSAQEGATSGVRRGMQLDTERPGGDLRELTVEGPRPELCQAACARERGCAAWTLVTEPVMRADGAEGERNLCRLARSAGPAVAAIGRISGTRGGAFF